MMTESTEKDPAEQKSCKDFIAGKSKTLVKYFANDRRETSLNKCVMLLQNLSLRCKKTTKPGPTQFSIINRTLFVAFYV